jgi:hypothetical protein
MSERDPEFERALLRADIRAGNTDAAAMQYDFVAKNTDLELWRKGDGDGNGMSYYEPSIHVTQGGDIGINVGGTVYTLPVEDWHALAGSYFANGPGGVTTPNERGEWVSATPMRTPWGVRLERWWKNR